MAPAALERLLEGEDAGVGHEEVLLEVPEGLEEGLDRLACPLDDVLERRDPLEEVLVERDFLGRLLPLRDDADPGKDEELGVAARAVLFLVRVLQSANLAEHDAYDRAPSDRVAGRETASPAG